MFLDSERRVENRQETHRESTHRNSSQVITIDNNLRIPRINPGAPKLSSSTSTNCASIKPKKLIKVLNLSAAFASHVPWLPHQDLWTCQESFLVTDWPCSIIAAWFSELQCDNPVFNSKDLKTVFDSRSQICAAHVFASTFIFISVIYALKL